MLGEGPFNSPSIRDAGKAIAMWNGTMLSSSGSNNGIKVVMATNELKMAFNPVH